MELCHVGVHFWIVVPDVSLCAPIWDGAKTKWRWKVVGALELNAEEIEVYKMSGLQMRKRRWSGMASNRNPPSYLLVWETSHLVHIFLLDHESSQVSSVGGQEDDSKEGPHRHHDLTGGAFGILNRHRVVKDQTPQQPDGLTDGERWTVRLWKKHSNG